MFVVMPDSKWKFFYTCRWRHLPLPVCSIMLFSHIMWCRSSVHLSDEVTVLLQVCPLIWRFGCTKGEYFKAYHRHVSEQLKCSLEIFLVNWNYFCRFLWCREFPCVLTAPMRSEICRLWRPAHHVSLWLSNLPDEATVVLQVCSLVWRFRCTEGEYFRA